MGAPWGKIFVQILWPQSLPTLAKIASLAGVWACGDFALSGVLLMEQPTVGLAIKNRMVNYRLQESFQLVPQLLFAMVLVFILFQGINYVAGKKRY